MAHDAVELDLNAVRYRWAGSPPALAAHVPPRADPALLIALEAVLDRGTQWGARTAGYLVHPFTLVKLANRPRALIQTSGDRSRST